MDETKEPKTLEFIGSFLVGMEGLEPDFGGSCTRTIDAHMRENRLMIGFIEDPLFAYEFVIRVF